MINKFEIASVKLYFCVNIISCSSREMRSQVQFLAYNECLVSVSTNVLVNVSINGLMSDWREELDQIGDQTKLQDGWTSAFHLTVL